MRRKLWSFAGRLQALASRGPCEGSGLPGAPTLSCWCTKKRLCFSFAELERSGNLFCAKLWLMCANFEKLTVHCQALLYQRFQYRQKVCRMIYNWNNRQNPKTNQVSGQKNRFIWPALECKRNNMQTNHELSKQNEFQWKCCLPCAPNLTK